MNKQKILKTLAFPALGVALLLPTLSLTSCSTISQYLIPIATNNPFSNIQLIDQYAKHGRYGDDATDIIPTDKQYIHIPTGYIYTSGFNNSYQPTIKSQYGFTSAVKPTWSYKDTSIGKSNPYLFNKNQINTYGWYSTGDEALNYFSGSNLSSYENLINYSTIYGVNSISSDLISMMNYIYIYLNQIISQPKDKVDKYLSVALANSNDANDKNGFIHGLIDSAQNIQFYQFLLSNANVISTGNSSYKFGTYQIDWKVKASPIDEDNPTSLFISLTDVTNLATDPNFGYPVDDKQAYIFPTNQSYSGYYKWNENNDNKYTWHPKDDDYAKMSRYCIYEYDEKDASKITDVIGIENMPILIHLNSLSSSYYNPTKHLSSIQPTDWVNTNYKDVSKAIKKSNAWEQFVKQNKVNEKVNNLASTNFNLNLADNLTPSITDYTDWWWDEHDATKIDPNILEWETDGLIQPGDFILLANYSFTTIDITYKFKTTSGENTTHYKTKIPYFSGFSGFYPAYMLFTNEKVYKLVNEKDKSSNAPYCIDGRVSYTDNNKKKQTGYLYKLMSDAMKHLTTHNNFLNEALTYSTNNQAFNYKYGAKDSNNGNPNMLLYWIFATNAATYIGPTKVDSLNWFN